jgi:hypothetical protein
VIAVAPVPLYKGADHDTRTEEESRMVAVPMTGGPAVPSSGMRIELDGTDSAPNKPLLAVTIKV